MRIINEQIPITAEIIQTKNAVSQTITNINLDFEQRTGNITVAYQDEDAQIIKKDIVGITTENFDTLLTGTLNQGVSIDNFGDIEKFLFPVIDQILSK